MRFPFRYPVMLCDRRLAEIGGIAIVQTRSEPGANLGNAYWHVAGLVFERTDDNGNRVTTPMHPSHALYRPICLWLLNERRADIQAAWLASGHAVARAA